MLHPLVGRNASNLSEQKYHTRLERDAFYMADHAVGGINIPSAMTYLEMARAAGELAGEQPISAMDDLHWKAPFAFSEGQEAQILFGIPKGDRVGFTINALRDDQPSVEAVSGTLIFGEPQDLETLDLDTIRTRLGEPVSGEAFYKNLEDSHLKYGASLKTLRSLQTGDNEVLAQLSLDGDDSARVFTLHPALLEGAFQAAYGLTHTLKAQDTWLPVALGRLTCYGPVTGNCLAYIHNMETVVRSGKEQQVFDLMISDEDGNVLAAARKLQLEALPADQVPEKPELILWSGTWAPEPFKEKMEWSLTVTSCSSIQTTNYAEC